MPTNSYTVIVYTELEGFFCANFVTIFIYTFAKVVGTVFIVKDFLTKFAWFTPVTILKTAVIFTASGAFQVVDVSALFAICTHITVHIPVVVVETEEFLMECTDI